MKKLLKRWMALVLALLMTASLAACGAVEEGEVLRVCLGGAQETLDPIRTETDDNATILYHLYENLLRQQSEGAGAVTLVNGVASGYTETDNFDGTITYTFTIAPTAKWSDGQAVTAEDFVYSWQRLLLSETENREVLAMIEGYDAALESGEAEKLAVRATEDGALEVTTSYHCPYFLTAVCAGAATMPVRRDVVEQAGETFGRTKASLVTNGAYVLENWETAERLDLIRNPAADSARGPDRLQFFFEEDAEEAYVNFSSGMYDFISFLPDAAVEKLKQTEGWSATPSGMAEMILLGRSGAFADADVREAFALAMDVDALAACLRPADQLATGLVPYGIRESDGEDFRTVGGAVFDLQAADYETRCEEAKNILRKRDTYVSEVELIYVADEGRQEAVQMLHSSWQDRLGIRVRLTPLSEEDMALRLEQNDYDMAWVTLRASYADGAAFLETGTNGLTTALAAEEDEYTRLMSVLRGALDPLARDNYLHAAEKMIFENWSVLPVTFLGISQEKAGEVRGIGYDGLGRYLFHAVRIGE